MQKKFKKWVVFVFVSFFGLNISVRAVPIEDKLIRADSLYEQGRYDSAALLYRQVAEANRISPQLLLRLAYGFERSARQQQNRAAKFRTAGREKTAEIRQARARNYFTETLYYLSVYQHHYGGEEVRQKIRELADELRLTGYDISDEDVIGSFFKHYAPVLTLTALLLAGLTAGRLLFLRLKRSEQPTGLTVSFVAFMLLTLVFVNFRGVYDEAEGWSAEKRTHAFEKALLVRDGVYIMSEPSAAGEVLSFSEAGHRVSITGEDDIWYRIRWHGDKAFIRKDNLRLIR